MEAMMFDIAVGILIGAFIGWHIPEPMWAKIVKQKIKDWLDRQDSKPIV